MWSQWLVQAFVRVQGSRGQLRVINPTTPQLLHRLRVKSDRGSRTEHLSRRPTYEYQLDAFCEAVAGGATNLTPPADSIANMRVVDAIYEAAGMKPRGT
jgi:predicted dehydrogenase